MTFIPYPSLKTTDQSLPGSCVSVRCQGYENSLAECIIYDSMRIGSRKVATVSCYDASQDTSGEEPRRSRRRWLRAPLTSDLSPLSEDDNRFGCVNGKRVSLNQTCDGVDDCGDRSDEMCCQSKAEVTFDLCGGPG